MPPEIKFKAAVLFISLCVLSVSGWHSQAVAAQRDYVEDEVLVLLDQDSEQSTKTAMEAISGAAVKKQITFTKSRLSKKSRSNHDMPGHSILRVKLPKGKTVPAYVPRVTPALLQWYIVGSCLPANSA